MADSPSASPQLENLDKHSANNGQYIALLSHDGSKILMSQTRPSYLRIPALDTGTCSPIASGPYRAEVCQIIGFNNLEIHIIEERTFDEYDLNNIGCAVSLTIIEVISEDATTRSPLLWIDWKQNSAAFGSTREHPAVSRYLKSFLDNLGSQNPRNMRLPWYCFGYYRRIRPLLMERLKTLGYEVSGEPEQIRFSCHSSTYRIPSKPDHLFFKACPVGSNELFNTQVMCHFFPTDVVRLIGLVPELNGILTLDAGPSLSKLIWDPPDTRKNHEYRDKERIMDFAVRHWANFQQRSSSSVAQLKARGLAVCDEAWMKEGFKELKVYCHDHKLISEENLALMETCNEIIEETFTLWKSSGIPETIVHGDLCEDNLAQPGGPGAPLVMFDLRTVFIGYPFFDLRDPAWSMMHMSESTYLRCWKHCADPETISALAELTRPMDYLVTAIMRMRDMALWSEFIASEIRSNVCSFVEQTKNLSICALPTGSR